jgi:hypothetical protein
MVERDGVTKLFTQRGVRGAHEDAKFGKQMKMMSIVVTDQELNDIAAFLNAQSREQ